MQAIFLSASVPDQKRDPKYYDSADLTGIRDAVRALVTVVLPKARLVWGGHPAITPLIRVVAEDIGITEGDRIRLFQSNYFRGKMPNDNAAFEKVVKVRAAKDRDTSLYQMRKRMIGSEQFTAGVFIGGMEGVEEEYRIFREMHPEALLLPIASTGAAALLVYRAERGRFPSELETNMAYSAMFRRFLDFHSEG